MIPEDIANDPNWERIDFRKKYVADTQIVLNVTLYIFGVYLNRLTGGIRKTPIPDALKGEMNYGPGLKGMCLLLNQYGNMPSRKTAEFIAEASNGAIRISNGFTAGLARKFADGSKPEWNEIFARLIAADHLHVDATVAKMRRQTLHTDEYGRQSGHAVALAPQRERGGEEYACGTLRRPLRTRW